MLKDYDWYTTRSPTLHSAAMQFSINKMYKMPLNSRLSEVYA